MDNVQLLILFGGAAMTIVVLAVAFAGPSVGKAQARRLETLRGRHAASAAATVESQMRKITANRGSASDGLFSRYIPNPALLEKRLGMTGKSWTISRYAMTCLVITLVIAGLAVLQGAPLVFGLVLGVAVGLVAPHLVVGMQIKKRITAFNARFPDAIDLMVRGLRSGLPISETLGIVSSEIPDPVGTEFRAVADRIKIGRTMEQALEEAAEKIDTAEFKFFCITLAIQRETGGNLAETLSNLGDVLRKRAQMKLKIKAMSSESKASAYIIGALPFFVFGMIYYVNSNYMGQFLVDERLMVAGLGGLVWMSIGAFIMSRMISFEI